MSKGLVPAIVLALALAAPVAAQSIDTKQSCETALKDARQMRARSDAGPKHNAEADTLLAQAEQLCGSSEFAQATRVLTRLRTLLATG